jgi:hypothetical protein
MKFFKATFLAAVLLPLYTLVAQDANSVPVPDKLFLDTPVQPSPAPAPDSLSLIPDAPPPMDKPPRRSGSGGSHSNAQNPIRKNKTEAGIQDFAERIKFREAKTKALRDEQIQQELSNADAARKDREKREALKRYYKLLYAKILKIDGSLKKIVAQRQEQSLKQLEQSNVRTE